MANSFGSLWVGASGLQSASHGLNTTSNNLSNVNTAGYVREQVVYEDREYRKIGTAAVSTQYSGLGVQVGTIVHARDVFLDKAYRSESGRYSFYQASADAVDEVQTYLQESDGEAFKDALANFYEAFAEFAKDPSDTVNQNLVLQKAGLFLSRATAVSEGLEDYQSIINSKIREKVDRINEIGKEIVKLNKQVQAIEASGVEQAMEIRDKRDLLLDELSGMARISYNEDINGIVRVEIEGFEFVDEVKYNEIGMYTDLRTGFVTPYWVHLSDLSDPENPDYYDVYPYETLNDIKYLSNVSAAQDSDIGEIKALMLARGDAQANYLSLLNLDSDEYDRSVGNSVMMSSEAEMDKLIHEVVTSINDLFSPINSVEEVYKDDIPENATLWILNDEGEYEEYAPNTKVCDVVNCDVGSDGEIPPRELFVRIGTDRYTEKTVYLRDADGNPILDEETKKPLSIQVYEYNEEDPEDTSKCYTLKSLKVNEELVEMESLLPFKKYMDQTQIDYSLGDALEKVWNTQSFSLNPSDTTPCTFREFYTKWVGEIGTTGSIYTSTATSLSGTKEQIEFSRQGVIGVSSDEELTSMIKYQSAYNAASRYINVVNEMIEHLLSTLAS